MPIFNPNAGKHGPEKTLHSDTICVIFSNNKVIKTLSRSAIALLDEKLCTYFPIKELTKNVLEKCCLFTLKPFLSFFL